MSRYLAYVALLASFMTPGIATAATHSANTASWSCQSTTGSTSCATHPAPVTQPTIPPGIDHRHHGPSFHQQ